LLAHFQLGEVSLHNIKLYTSHPQARKNDLACWVECCCFNSICQERWTHGEPFLYLSCKDRKNSWQAGYFTVLTKDNGS